MSDSIFFAKLPPLQQLCHVTLKISEETFDFHLQILKCRQLLSLCPHVIAVPQIGNKSLIDAVVHVDFYKKRFGYICHKIQVKPTQASIARNLIVESCILYTIKFKLAPQWNQVGNLLLGNSDFLLCSGKIEAVKFDVTVREEELTLKIKPFLIRLPPPKLENFVICPQALKLFHEDANYEVPESAINMEWCHILPTMKKGQIVRISHNMPSNTSDNKFLNNYEGLRKYWKIQYGYCLPESADDMIYCSVFFKQIDANLFTYPLLCLRSRPIQYMPRCDAPIVANKFFGDLREKFDKLCGLPIKFSPKACSSSNNLASASEIKPCVPQNVRIVEDKRKTTSYNNVPTPMQLVPNDNIILSSQQKDVSNQTVPCNDLRLKKMFPTSSDGKFIPVFGRKKTFRPGAGISESNTKRVSNKNVRKLQVEKQQSGSCKPPAKSSSKQPLAEVTNQRPSCNKRHHDFGGNSSAKKKKHKFDEMFATASSSARNEQGKKENRSAASASFQAPTVGSSAKSGFRAPMVQTRPLSKKTCQFESFFKPASKS